MKLSRYWRYLYLPFIVVILTLFTFVLITFSVKNIILDATKSILSVIFIVFLPGYLLTNLLFRDNLHLAEKLVLSIGFSICITILMSMLVYYAQLRINFPNIMFNILFVSLILSVLTILKPRRIPLGMGRRRMTSRIDKTFFFSLFLLILVLCIIVYFSIIFPSKEEFVELYWKVSELKTSEDRTNINCSIENCSLSGVYKLGSVNLLDNSYDVIITDLNENGMYDSICLDINQNHVFCEDDEGPFIGGDSFRIDSSSFSIILRDNKFFIFNFPKEINISNFTVGFTVKSNYKEVKDFKIGLSVNETLQYSEDITLEPNQEISYYYPVYLSEDGLYRVRIALLPLTLEDRTYIEFWVEKFNR